MRARDPSSLGYSATAPSESRGKGHPRQRGGVARPEGVSAPGARPAGAREGLPPRGGGAGAPSPLTAPAREFQFETQRREEAGAAAQRLGLKVDWSLRERAREVRCLGKEACGAAEWRVWGRGARAD